MKGSVPAEVAYTKIEDALRVINSAPASPSANLIERALLLARARMKHLEQRLGETETMRDRIAMQLLPGIQDRASQMHGGIDSDDCIRLAYHQADKVLAIRLQGSAGVPGETTSPDFPIRG